MFLLTLSYPLIVFLMFDLSDKRVKKRVRDI